MGRQLIAYYSRRGQNLVGGELRDLAGGNTELAAEMLQVLTRADIFRIEPVQEYSSDYCRCIDQARQDLLRGVWLELKRWPEGWDEYDTIYLGYPNHWNTRWRCSPFWNSWTSPARPYAPSVSMSGAAWAAA